MYEHFDGHMTNLHVLNIFLVRQDICSVSNNELCRGQCKKFTYVVCELARICVFIFEWSVVYIANIVGLITDHCGKPVQIRRYVDLIVLITQNKRLVK